jgi:hypothetical protein
MGLRAASRWCEGCRNKGKAQLSSARSNFQTAFQTLSRQEAILGSTIENNNLLYISMGYGGESVSQSPLKDQAFSTFLDQNPPFELLPENGISPSTKACPAQWPVVDNSASSD